MILFLNLMKKSQLILVIFIVFIMITSAIGFVYVNPKDNNTNSFDYKGFKFYLTNNAKYQVDVNNKQFIFDYLPNDLTNIEIPNFNLQNEKYYLLMNYTEKDSNLDYNLNKLGYSLNLISKRTNLACINEKECNQELPIKDCGDDAFYIKKNNINKVYLQDKCIIIQGDDIYISKVVDKINLKLVGIE